MELIKKLLYAKELYVNFASTIKYKMSENYKILAIDDSTTNTILLEAVLQAKGYTIITAFNAKEAWSIVRKNSVDLILLDLLMPDINGFDFLKQIKGHPAYANIPVLIVSAANSKENIDRCYDLGATSFIDKPIDINLLIQTVEQSLQNI